MKPKLVRLSNTSGKEKHTVGNEWGMQSFAFTTSTRKALCWIHRYFNRIDKDDQTAKGGSLKKIIRVAAHQDGGLTWLMA